jgi:hypothetical protein
MTKRLVFVCMALLTFIIAKAQTRTINGIVTDQQTKVPLVSATVKLSSLSDTISARNILTDSAGKFSFGGLAKDSFLLSVSYIGYSAISRIVAVDTLDVNLKIAVVPGASTNLATVIITTNISPVTQKEDTLQFNASQFKVNPDATSEDLVKKVPGITVENGQVKAQGEVVQRVTLDGRELFGDDATAALRGLPAEVVDKIQVLDRLSDQDRASGVVTGETQKEINIVTKAGMRNGQYGRVYAGYGTDDRYSLGGNTTFLKENRRISLVGQSNNINQQNFSSQDLLGVTSSGGRSGFGGPPPPPGGRGGGGNNRGGGGNFGGGFGGGNNFMVGQQNGINRTNALGINYSDLWGKKIRISGSYFYNNSKNTTQQESTTQYLQPVGDLSQINQNINSTSNNTNHRINMRLEYQIDSANQLIISPNLSFQNNKSDRLTDVQNINTSGVLSTETINRTNSIRNGNNLNNNILYSHNFPKRGRTFSINLNTSYNKRTGKSYTDYSKQDFIENFDSTDNRFSDQFNKTFQVSARLSYTEPLSTKSQLQFTYNPSWSKSKADQMSYSYDSTTQSYSDFNEQLSNVFDNKTTAQNGGIAFRSGDRDNQFTAGVNYQRTELYNNRTYPAPAFEGSKAFNNILPNAFARFKLSSRSNLRLFYRTNVNQPSITQLQDVVDATNPPFYSQGNPELKPQYSHSLNGAYTFTNTGKGKVFVANMYAQKSNNYITNATYIVQGRDSAIGKNVLVRNDQLTKPINVDGYYNLRSFLTYAFPLRFIKSNLNMNGGFNYSNIPGVFNNQNIKSKTYTYSLGTVISSNVSQYVDFTVSYFANYNTTIAEAGSTFSSKIQKTTQNFFSHTGSVQLNLLSKKGWFFQNDLNNQLQWQTTTEQYWLWNMSVGKKFLKDRKGELKLTAFDVLKQNVSFSRSVSEDGNSIYTQRSQVLTQYFLLTFTYNLRNFGKAATRTPSRGNFNQDGLNRGNFNRGGLDHNP